MCNDLITKYEGFSEIAYICPAGVWTFGYGSTYKQDGTPVQKGDTITKIAAEALLNDYIIKNVFPIFNKIPYQLTKGQKDAISSLVYNIGTSAFLKSKLFKAICKKDLREICKQWDWYCADDKVLSGLVKRRVEELHYFMSGI